MFQRTTENTKNVVWKTKVKQRALTPVEVSQA